MKRQNAFKIALMLFAVTLISSCATIPSQQLAFNKNLTWNARKQQLMHLQKWQARGAIAVKDQNQSFTVYYNWKQLDTSRYQIHLFGPLGIGAVTITGDSRKVTLINAKGQVFTAKTPEELMQSTLGFSLPISNLYFWIRGLPAHIPNTNIAFDEYNHASEISQNGWKVQYKQYTAANQCDLPSIINITAAGFAAKIIISSWAIES